MADDIFWLEEILLKKVINNNLAINIDNESSIANTPSVKIYKSTANTSVALITTKDIPEKSKVKHELISTASNNQNLDNDV